MLECWDDGINPVQYGDGRRGKGWVIDGEAKRRTYTWSTVKKRNVSDHVENKEVLWLTYRPLRQIAQTSPGFSRDTHESCVHG